MSDHPTPAEIEAFVLGIRAAAPGSEFEAHVSSCSECAALLAHEARVELALGSVAASSKAPPARARRAVMTATIAALAAAAAWAIARAPAPAGAADVAMIEALRRAPIAASDPIPAAVCPAGPDQRACIEQAHRHGLFVDYPASAGAPQWGGRAADGPSTCPFP